MSIGGNNAKKNGISLAGGGWPVRLVINEKYFGSARNNSVGAISIIKAITRFVSLSLSLSLSLAGRLPLQVRAAPHNLMCIIRLSGRIRGRMGLAREAASSKRKRSGMGAGRAGRGTRRARISPSR
jgi:hypothetical protein